MTLTDEQIAALWDAVRARELPWEINEHGAWCTACGDCLAAPHNIDEDYELPDNCRQCGYPDFEEGTGYFSGEDDGDD